MNNSQKRKLLTKAVRENFLVFLHRVFLEIDNSQAFVPNWHLEVIADRLLSVQEGKQRRLITLNLFVPVWLFRRGFWAIIQGRVLSALVTAKIWRISLAAKPVR